MPYDSTDFVAAVRMLDRDPKTLTTPRERLEYLRDFLLKLPEKRFNMQFFSVKYEDNLENTDISPEQVRNDCGTQACIAGWCSAIFSDKLHIGGSYDAMKLLGLQDAQAGTLFYANHDSENADVRTYWNATPVQAAAVLTHLLDTSTPGTTDGVVDWSVV